ncbi:hypothetical protein EVB27_133 [Rhizobium phage RHph_TM16]|nr:hypothetical protein EVB27_133 [Rhizobium phage RHph_TM16]
MDNRHVTVSIEAVQQAKKLGFLTGARARLERMALRSAVITHPQGNRRFGNYLLRIHNGTLEAIMEYDPGTKTVIR